MALTLLNSLSIPPNTVVSSDIEDDAVTVDKLANSINTEIAANTAKVTNATHTGDVTGATALTIADGVVGVAMLSAPSPSSTKFLRGDNSWVEVGGAYSDWEIINSATNPLIDKVQYISNSASALTHTLPTGTDLNRTIIIHNAGAGTVTVGRGGQNINSTADDGELLTNATTQLVYVNTTIGWKEI